MRNQTDMLVVAGALGMKPQGTRSHRVSTIRRA